MPNHITNIIQCDNPTVIEFMLNDEGDVDFNAIIPMPEHLDPSQPVRLEKRFETEDNWYDWSLNNWHTKWNAYRTDRVSDDRIKFETAWTHVFKVIEGLSLEFPGEIINVAYADEDYGNNLGLYSIKAGQVIREVVIESQTADADNLSCLISEGRSFMSLMSDWGEEDIGFHTEEQVEAYSREYDPIHLLKMVSVS